MDNVIPLYDLFEGNLYSLWQRIFIFGGFIFMIALAIYLYFKSQKKVMKLRCNRYGEEMDA